jgi:ABC-type dipeptide/oligopeptide/nickel transport system permease component
MGRFLLRRILLLPLILILLNMTGFAYATLAVRIHQAQSPFGHREQISSTVVQNYLEYAGGLLHFDLGDMPVGAKASVAGFVAKGLGASLGLFGVAFLVSLLAGLPLGRAAVQRDPPRSRSWITVLATLGLAMPGFYAGTLLVSLVLWEISGTTLDPLLPVAGFGWDLHLILPAIALAIRPTAQIAQVTAGLLSEELTKRYVTAARGFGHSWRAIMQEKALKNILAPLYLSISGAFRLSVAELILVEYLFDWPGIGRMLARTLVPPKLVSPGGLIDLTVYFLHPPLMAALLPLFGMLFYLVDTLASALARGVDPRLGSAAHEEVLYE